MNVSVIIPTYNRGETLRKTLHGYAGQLGEHRILEVIVVDDGSHDNTHSVVEECMRDMSLPLRYLHQENRGLAAARNHAIREVRGDLILFGDDDIVPAPNMVAEHVSWHHRYPQGSIGVLGYVPWAPDVHPTPFMVWSGHYGPQFHFGLFKPNEEVDYWHAYFCNTSVKTIFLRQNGLFDEIFRAYGWEDVEFSYRLYQSGWRVRYNPDAVGYHNKYETFKATLRRTEQLWWKGWPVYARTAAGRHFFNLWFARRAQVAEQRPKRTKTLLRPLKLLAMPALKLLMDSSVKLPTSLYERVWNHYSIPIVEVAFNSSCRELETWPGP